MPAHSTMQFRAFRPTFGDSQLLGRGLIVAIAAVAFVVGFGMSDLTARSGAAPSGPSVNRVLKGDRLPLAPAVRPNGMRQAPKANSPRETAAKLPIGCDALASSLASRQAARIAGRCVS